MLECGCSHPITHGLEERKFDREMSSSSTDLKLERRCSTAEGARG